MYLAIDIGGTKTLLALFSRSGRKLKTFKFKTDQNPEVFIFHLKEHLEVFLRGRKVKTVTAAIAGIVPKNGRIKYGNLPWGNYDLLTELTTLITAFYPHKTPRVLLENDANLAAIAEAKGQKGRSVYLTFSTGIGGGLVEKNRLLETSTDFEPGHIKYKWHDRTLEWEDIASANALLRDYGKMATDLRGRKIYEDMAARVALGLAPIIREQAPRQVIIGGALGIMLPRFKKFLRLELAYKGIKTPPRLLKAKHPLESVIYGCYLYGKTYKAPAR